MNVAADRSGCFRLSKHHPVLCLATARALERVMLPADELPALVLDHRHQVQAGVAKQTAHRTPRFHPPLLVGVVMLASNGCETGCPQEIRRMVYDGPSNAVPSSDLGRHERRFGRGRGGACPPRPPSELISGAPHAMMTFRSASCLVDNRGRRGARPLALPSRIRSARPIIDSCAR
jgi:hypothetical protein